MISYDKSHKHIAEAKVDSRRQHNSCIATVLTPETNKFDCGLNLHENTKLACPRNSTNASPVSALHNRNVLSSLAVTMYDAVGDHVTSRLGLCRMTLSWKIGKR